VLLPPGYNENRPEPYPLLLQLHGGAMSHEEAFQLKFILDQDASPLAPLAEFVVACFHCPGKTAGNIGGGQYVDSYDGSQLWDTFATQEFIPYIREQYHVGDSNNGKTAAMGISMGGAGALRISFRHPELFCATAALEPHIHAGLSFGELSEHQRAIETPHQQEDGQNCQAIRNEAYGEPLNESHWQSWQPANMATEYPERILSAGLKIYLECGDRDEFEFNFATEYLHRVLLDKGIEHDYRLLHGVDHTGEDLIKRVYDALLFISAQVSPATQVSPQTMAMREHLTSEVSNRKQAAGYREQTVAEKYRAAFKDL